MHSKQSETTRVSAKGLRKSFGERKVLNGVDLNVEPGQVAVVLGKSGTGKSVLLKLLIGLEKPDSGSISIGGQEIPQLQLEELNAVRKRIGFLFQQAALYDSMTIAENVAFPLIRHTKLTPDERASRVRELLSSVGMDAELDKMPAEISGGMKKRVGLARALALEPQIVLFDEPTAGLDPITAAEIRDLILRLKQEQKMTSIVVTHDVHTARAIADRWIVLHQGKVAVDGSFGDLENSQDPFVAQFLKEAG